MKGIVLTGGLGTRLSPLTKVCNKHLLPVYNKPMVYYPIETLVKAGITEIMIVCGGNSAGQFLQILGNGEEFGLKRLHYTYQSEPRGIADALGLARDFVDGDPVAVILGDNVFQDDIYDAVEAFRRMPYGAVIFGKEVSNPQHYGVIEFTDHGDVHDIVEKPKFPKSNLIATGLYLYDSTVWKYIDGLTPSARGELEITDVNTHYLYSDRLKVSRLEGDWLDCGESFDMYLQAQNVVAGWAKGDR